MYRGGVRTFVYRRVYRNILTKVVTRLQPADVFFVLSATSQNPIYEKRFSNVPVRVDQEKLNAALAAFRPVHIDIFNASSCSCVRNARVPSFDQPWNRTETDSRPCCDGGSGGVKTFMQIHWVKHCFEEVERYERRRGMTFKVWIRLRPDVYYLSNMQYPRVGQLVQNGITISVMPKPDLMFALRRSSVDWFNALYADYVKHCIVKLICFGSYSSLKVGKRTRGCIRIDETMSAPEYTGWFPLLGSNTVVHGSKHWRFADVAMHPVIVRGPHTADCERLSAHRQECEAATRRGWHA